MRGDRAIRFTSTYRDNKPNNLSSQMRIHRARALKLANRYADRTFNRGPVALAPRLSGDRTIVRTMLGTLHPGARYIPSGPALSAGAASAMILTRPEF